MRRFCEENEDQQERCHDVKKSIYTMFGADDIVVLVT